MDIESVLITCGFLIYGWLLALSFMQALNQGWQPLILVAGLVAGYLLRLAYGRGEE
jgi:hypothetical protein